MSNTSNTPTSIKIPTTLRNRIQSLANLRDRSVHAILLQAIETYVEREEKREQLRQEAIKAHDEYMLTGLHVSNTEIKSWLSELAEGNRAEPPKCHQ